jgi:hypothetical protein
MGVSNTVEVTGLQLNDILVIGVLFLILALWVLIKDSDGDGEGRHD